MIITKTVTVDAEVDVEIELHEFSDAELIEEMEERELYPEAPDHSKLELIYEEFRRRGDAPECLREYLYSMIGRTL